jgi:drug/metabolite transporter (DMT)-like permease
MAYPLIVVVVNAAFAGIVGRQYFDRRRPYQLVWTVALVLGMLAALFYVLFLVFNDNTLFFKLYYICGALLMAAYLGLGSIYLHMPTRFADITAAGLVILSVVGIVMLLTAGINHAQLVVAASQVGPGTKALEPGPWKAMVAILNIFGSIAVIGGAIYSAWRTHRRQAPLNFLYANVLIAVGTFLAAAAGSAADQGAFPGSFWVLLALGFVVLFCGFLLATVSWRGLARAGAAVGSNQ